MNAQLRRLPLLPALSAPQASAPAPRTPPRSVRLSLTDRCDLACVYCRPHRHDGYLDDRLDDAAWKVMVTGLVEAGVRRVRLTGGEPLLHPRVVDLVGYLAGLGLSDLAMTTNATRLDRLAGPLRRAGLRRLTVSIDSLVPGRFARLTRGGDLARVLGGLDAALAAGFEEVKLNAVVLRGENDDEIEALTRFSWERGVTPRFIELMKIGEGANLPADSVVTAAEMRAKLDHLLEESPALVDPERGPARYVKARHDGRLRVGFISGTSDTYCSGCDRLRVASDGFLRPCLATNEGVDAALLARSGDAAAVSQAVAEAWSLKPDEQTWKGCTEESASTVSIRSIGGLHLRGHHATALRPPGSRSPCLHAGLLQGRRPHRHRGRGLERAAHERLDDLQHRSEHGAPCGADHRACRHRGALQHPLQGRRRDPRYPAPRHADHLPEGRRRPPHGRGPRPEEPHG